MFIENEEKFPSLEIGDKVCLMQDVRTLEGIFTKGHEFIYSGMNYSGMWFSDKDNRLLVIERLSVRNINDTFTIKKVENADNV